MHDLLFEMDWVPALRSHTLTVFFRAITELGSNWFAFVFLMLGLLLGRRSAFARLIVVCAFSEILNAHLKSAYMAPRPDPAYRLIDVAGWSFPSGHAQHGTVMWLWLAWETGRSGAWVAGALLSLSIALSRVYLGVHFGADIVAGSILGLTVMAYFLWLFDYRHRNPNHRQSALAWGLIGVVQLVWVVLIPNGSRLYMLLPGFIYVGFSAGIALGRRWPTFPKPRLVWSVLSTAVFFGIGIFTELYGGSVWIGPFGLGTHPVSIHLQFALLGVWMGLIAPKILKRFNLPGIS